MKRVAVIGGGAAGFFAAMSVKKHFPNAEVTIFEKSSKVLAKVKVSGGGRCNVTHNQTNIKQLASNYPRGEKFLRKAFSQFSVLDTIAWFKQRGVELKVEPDNRMFPESNTSQTIIDTFLKETQTIGVRVQKSTGMTNLLPVEGGLELHLSDEKQEVYNSVIIALGGQKSIEKFDLFSRLGHKIESPVPSLFTFNIKDKITNLMGLVSPNVNVKIQGSKLQNSGPLLVTHWGMSGPAILKLSSLAARELAHKKYEFKIQLNWLGEVNEEKVREILNAYISSNGKKQVNKNPFDIPNRLWLFFLDRLNISVDKMWSEIDKKSKNRIVNAVVNDVYQVSNKTTFKEEFVICGGVSLSGVNPKTMESRVMPNLFFAGEVLDIDGVTGGFNFQAAWTTGYIAGKLGV